MKTKTFKYMIVALAFVGVVAVGTPMTVNAIVEEENTQRTDPSAEPRIRIAEDTSRGEQHRSAVKDRLTNARLKSCQAREKAITNIMTRASERGERHIVRLGKITERVQAFYVKKEKTLENYDQLVADVEAKKAAAQDAVNDTALLGADFSCSADNPKETISDFKAQLKTRAAAMKDFRTAVKNLIVGVKSVQGSTMSERGE